MLSYQVYILLSQPYVTVFTHTLFILGCTVMSKHMYALWGIWVVLTITANAEEDVL